MSKFWNDIRVEPSKWDIIRNNELGLSVLLALQGFVGLDQYKTHLPTQLVWVHVGLACCAWLAAVWAACTG